VTAGVLEELGIDVEPRPKQVARPSGSWATRVPRLFSPRVPRRKAVVEAIQEQNVFLHNALGCDMLSGSIGRAACTESDFGGHGQQR